MPWTERAPDDAPFVPRLDARAKAGPLRIVGDGKALVDVSGTDNVMDAHLLAAEKRVHDPLLRGTASFPSNGETIAVATMINALHAAAGLSPVTRFLAKQLSTPHGFDISAARRELGDVPKVSTAEGLARLARALRG